MEFVVRYLHSFGIMALLAVLYGLSFRTLWPRIVLRIGLGLLFGASAAFAMKETIAIAEGVYVDPRNLFIGLAAAFLGPWGAGAALLVGYAERISIGGAGVYTGLVSMGIAMAAGLFWAKFIYGTVCEKYRCLFLLGAMLSLSLFGVILLPRETAMQILTKAAPYTITFNIVGAVLFGSLMERERINALRIVSLKQEATTDPLTRLLNRRGLAEAIADMPEERKSSPSALLVLDIDHFKSVNDQFGHDVGDLVLLAISSQLRAGVRKGDLVGRFGGEEFIVLLPDITPDEAKTCAERLRILVSEIGALPDGSLVPVTISIGGYWNCAGIDLREAIRMADQALYRAKGAGRNRTEFLAA